MTFEARFAFPRLRRVAIPVAFSFIASCSLNLNILFLLSLRNDVLLLRIVNDDLKTFCDFIMCLSNKFEVSKDGFGSFFLGHESILAKVDILKFNKKKI